MALVELGDDTQMKMHRNDDTTFPFRFSRPIGCCPRFEDFHNFQNPNPSWMSPTLPTRAPHKARDTARDEAFVPGKRARNVLADRHAAANCETRP